MKKNYFYILLLISVTIISCTKENTELRLSDFETPLISGYYLRDVEGNNIGIIGNPNVKLGNTSNDNNSQYYFTFHPNPCTKSCYINIKTPASEELKKIWITPANWENQISDNIIDLNNTNNIFVGGTPIFQTEFYSDRVAIDLSQFPEGYYRIYLKVNEYVLYDNIVIYN